MVDPPCHQCGDTTQTQGEAQVAAWVQQSQEPEFTYIKGLLAMDRQIQQMGGASSNLLTPAAQKALSQFDDDPAFLSDAGTLEDRLLNGKAIPMAEKYDKEPRQAYAGITLLLAVSRNAALVQAGSGSKPDQALVMDLANTWEQSIANKIDSDVVGGHKYNLCPVYGEIIRTVTLLSGQGPDMEQYAKMLNKLQNLVKFNVNMSLKVDVTGNDGSHMHATWTGKAGLKLNLDLANSCYTPLFENGGRMAVNVTRWDLITVESQPGGSKMEIPAQLTSSHAYNVNLGPPQLNVCDPQPIFQIPLANLIVPQEEITAEGHSTSSSFLAPFLTSVVEANEVNSAEANAVTGQAPSLPGASPSSQSSPSSNSGSAAMDQAKQLVESHQGDANWLMSPAGQAAIANLQKQALQTAQAQMSSAGMVLPKPSSLAQLTQSMTSAHLPWTNGAVQPVSKTLHVKKDTADLELTVSVQQAPQ